MHHVSQTQVPGAENKINLKPTQPLETMNESKETPELLPVAYIINGIDALGRHYIREVRTPLDDEWKLDDGGLGDHWSGNEPLFRADSWKSRALTAEKERDELQEKLHAKHIEWDHAERSCSELRKHRDDWQAQALKAAQARLDAEAERDALKREVEGLRAQINLKPTQP